MINHKEVQMWPKHEDCKYNVQKHKTFKSKGVRCKTRDQAEVQHSGALYNQGRLAKRIIVFLISHSFDFLFTKWKYICICPNIFRHDKRL